MYRAAVSVGWQACAMACGVAIGEDAAGVCVVTVPIIRDVNSVGPETGGAGDAAMEASLSEGI